MTSSMSFRVTFASPKARRIGSSMRAQDVFRPCLELLARHADTPARLSAKVPSFAGTHAGTVPSLAIAGVLATSHCLNQPGHHEQRA